jgi:hypothetical protein
MRSETSFQLDGDLILVDAVVRGPSGRANVQLVVDTGAVLTTLAPSVARSIGYSPETSIKPTVTRTAAAVERGYLVQLMELSTSVSPHPPCMSTWPSLDTVSMACSG